MTLSRCKRCGRYPVYILELNEVRCPNGHFRFVAPPGKDVREVWECVQKSIRDERNWGQPEKLTRKERQEQFDMRIEADLRRRAINDMMAEDAAVYD